MPVSIRRRVALVNGKISSDSMGCTRTRLRKEVRKAKRNAKSEEIFKSIGGFWTLGDIFVLEVN